MYDSRNDIFLTKLDYQFLSQITSRGKTGNFRHWASALKWWYESVTDSTAGPELKEQERIKLGNQWYNVRTYKSKLRNKLKELNYVRDVSHYPVEEKISITTKTLRLTIGKWDENLQTYVGGSGKFNPRYHDYEPKEIDERTREKRKLNKQRRKEREKREQEQFQKALKEIKSYNYLNNIFHCSMEELLPKYSDVDAIITDPPYGSDAILLFGELARLAKYSLRRDGILAVMCGQTYLPEILKIMCQYMEYRWILCYSTIRGGQSSQQWQRKIVNFWKPVLIFGGKDWVGDYVKSGFNDKFHHKWGQNVEGFVDLVKRLTNPGELVIDPFVGAGTTALACIQTARRFVGCDIDKQYVDTTCLRMSKKT